MESSASSSSEENSAGGGCRLLLACGGLGKDEIECRRRGDFLHTLAHLDDLNGTGSRMRLDPPAFRPGIGVVMMTNIGDQQTVAGLVHDQADVAIDARRPEIGILAVIDTVQLETVADRVHLKVEDTRFHRFLVQARQAVERSGECIGDKEVHDPPNAALTPSRAKRPKRPRSWISPLSQFGNSGPCEAKCSV